jgi:hypothetical protein
MAVYLLGGDQRPIDTEDVAVKANELGPGRFTWSKYPDQINLELIRVFLSNAKKGPTALLSGTGRTGWTLTRAGVGWAHQNASSVVGKEVSKHREEMVAGSIDQGRLRRERSRVLETAGWARWAQGERDLTVREAREVFRIDLYAVGRMRELKVARLRASLGSDYELGPFVTAMAELINQEDSQ